MNFSVNWKIVPYINNPFRKENIYGTDLRQIFSMVCRVLKL